MSDQIDQSVRCQAKRDRMVAFWLLAFTIAVGVPTFLIVLGFGPGFVSASGPAETTVVSVSSVGTQTNGATGSPHMSRDGRFIAFHSSGSNLVPGDTSTTVALV